MWVILTMVAISGAVRGVGDRTRSVLLRPLVEAAGVQMRRMTAVHTGLGNLAMLVGAPIGGLLVYWLGAQRALWVDAASFALCALIVATLVRPRPDLMPERGPAEPYLVAVRGGARHLRADHLLLLMLTMIFVTNMVNQANSALFVPVWVEQVLGTPAALGILFGAFAAGALLGNLVFIALAPRLPQFVTFTICLAIGGVPRLLALALSDDLIVVLAATLISGLAISAVNPIFGALLFERVPNELQTRVFGLVATISFAGFPIGGVLGGWAVTALGLTTAALLGAGIYAVATLGPLLLTRTALTRTVLTRTADGAATATGPAGP